VGRKQEDGSGEPRCEARRTGTLACASGSSISASICANLRTPLPSSRGYNRQMARRHVHYERAFEAYLRARRIPYIAVDEARRTLLPHSRDIRFLSDGDDPAAHLKSFDCVVYGQGMNLLVDIKGRRVPLTRGGACSARLESWVTDDDVESLARGGALFNGGSSNGGG